MTQAWGGLAIVWTLSIGLTSTARADGGEILLRKQLDQSIVTLFGQPTPLRKGPALFSVLVQSLDGTPEVNNEVEFVFIDPHAEHGMHSEPIRMIADAAAGNELLQGVEVMLSSVGNWRLEIILKRDDGQHTIASKLRVYEAAGGFRRHWPSIVLGPVGALVLLIHQIGMLKRRNPWH